MTRGQRSLLLGLLGGALLTATTACAADGEPAETGGAGSTAAQSTAAEGTASPAAAPAGPISGPCDLLTDEQISGVLGIELEAGEAKVDDARQVQTCTWATGDLTTIVVAGLTDVDAEEAYQTNFDLAPAYFEGDPVETSVPGADRAYAVQQPDVGWVVGTVTADQFVQVQVGGTDITQQQAEQLAADAVARLAS
jgi:hypothetical protein